MYFKCIYVEQATAVNLLPPTLTIAELLPQAVL